MSETAFYPDPITSLPKIDVPFQGVLGHLLQGVDSQAVFFELNTGTEVPLHSHEAQFSVVLEGRIEMEIGDEIREYAKGDHFFIPEGAVHAGRPITDCKVVDFFFTPGRYKAKE